MSVCGNCKYAVLMGEQPVQDGALMVNKKVFRCHAKPPIIFPVPQQTPMGQQTLAGATIRPNVQQDDLACGLYVDCLTDQEGN